MSVRGRQIDRYEPTVILRELEKDRWIEIDTDRQRERERERQREREREREREVAAHVFTNAAWSWKCFFSRTYALRITHYHFSGDSSLSVLNSNDSFLLKGKNRVSTDRKIRYSNKRFFAATDGSENDQMKTISNLFPQCAESFFIFWQRNDTCVHPLRNADPYKTEKQKEIIIIIIITMIIMILLS